MSHTLVGCEAYILRDGKLLLGKRKNTYGAGTWALPGGHLEFLERLDVCLARELKEELDLDLDPRTFRLLATTDDVQPDKDTHYIHVTYLVDIGTKEPILNEPDACEEWRWFDLHDIPSNIFPPHQKIFATIASNKIYAHA